MIFGNLGRRKMDLIRELGPLAFASRLKRISEQLMRDVSRIYQEQDVDFQARWFPVLYLLGQKQSMSVTEIAQALRMTHPAINQVAAGMSEAGLLSSSKDEHDERRRMLALSSKGARTMTSLVPVWKDIETATTDLINSTDCDFLSAMDQLEAALEEQDIYQRVMARMKKRQGDMVEIIEFSPRYRGFFDSINREWLSEYFTVEDFDRKILSNPEGEIIRPGGHILFARLGDEIVGTVALMPHDHRIFEMAKMGVIKKARGRQVGKRLARAAIELARSEGAHTILLYTSPKLVAANTLYRKLGFQEQENAPQPLAYKRHSIMMILDIEDKEEKD
jgi:DNA-binding MarR family transcriptional regulator/predicted GNAT family N-acyltransferase